MKFIGTKKKYIMQSNEKWELKKALFSRKPSAAENNATSNEQSFATK